MNIKIIKGIIISAVGLGGVIYTGIGACDDHTNHNPLIGIAFVAMLLLTTGLQLINNLVKELQTEVN